MRTTPVSSVPPPRSLDDLVAAAAAFAAAARAPATVRAYQADWADFQAWCSAHSLTPLPAAPATVALYLSDRAATLRTATLRRRLAGLLAAHRACGQPLDLRDPALVAVWAGIRRTLGTAAEGKAPLLPADLRKVVALLPDTLAGARDKAMLLLGFAAALRRSEIAALEVGDLTHHAAGITVTVRRAKDDPEGRGHVRAVPRGESEETCPVRAVHAWLSAARLAAGPLFRPIDRFGRLQPGPLAPRAVARIIKKAVAAVALADGLSAAAVAARVAAVGGHSLRAGLVTAALLGGAQEAAVMRQTGHRTRRSLHRYVRLATLYSDNAATRSGL